MSITFLDLSAYVGLVAVGVVTLNLLLGMLMAFRYSPRRSWPHRRFNYFRLHNWSGYIALSVSLLHPAILLFNRDPRFRLLDLFYPIYSPSQPLENTIGVVAFYLLAFVVVTSYLRVRLGRHLWKSFHFSTYFAAGALFFHSLFTDPALKGDPIRLVRWWQGLRRMLFCADRGGQPAPLALLEKKGPPYPQSSQPARGIDRTVVKSAFPLLSLRDSALIFLIFLFIARNC